MSRCWRPDFYGDVFEGADFDVFILCFCSPQRWHLRNSSESGRWCWMCFYLDMIWEDILGNKGLEMLFAGLLSAQPEWLEAEGSKPECKQRVVIFLCTFCYMFVVDTNLAHFWVCLSKCILVICLLSCMLMLCFSLFHVWATMTPFPTIFLCSHFGLLGRAGGKPFPSAWTRRNENIRYRIFLRRLNTAFLASNWGMRHLRLLGIFLIKVVGGIVVAPKVKDGSSKTQTVSSDALKAGRKYLLTSFPQLKQVAPQLPWTKRKEDWFWDLGRFGDVKGNTSLMDSVAEILKKYMLEKCFP